MARSPSLPVLAAIDVGSNAVRLKLARPEPNGDLVAWDGDVLVFVEVKALHSGAPPEDAVGPRKQKRVMRAAQSYRAQYRLQNATYRFDILAVTARVGREPEFRLLRDAFGVRRY